MHLCISDWDEENEEDVNEHVFNIEESINRMERKHVTKIPPYVPLRMRGY